MKPVWYTQKIILELDIKMWGKYSPEVLSYLLQRCLQNDLKDVAAQNINIKKLGKLKKNNLNV